MTRIISVFTSILLTFGLSAQIQVQNTLTPSQLVQNVLMGFGVTATNVTINGSPVTANNIVSNATFFNAANTTFPIQSGVLLTTGRGIAAPGPNNSGSFSNNTPPTSNVGTDPHLNQIAAGTVTNGIVLEFDFVPSGDTISFKYIFGSDEYPEFSPSTFNDAFGFFLWGPGISGPFALAGYPSGGANLAVIPGSSTAVTINNVGPGAGQNPSFYVNNINGAAYGTAIQYDGTTVVLTANASVQCNQTYHIKLAICNVGDTGWDSGVFIEANSFTSEAVQVAVATVTGDDIVYEGCTTADFMFIRPQNQVDDELIINYTIGGTATMGVDYNDLPNPVVFPIGVDTVILTLNPFQDGISDNNETVIITATVISSCGDTLISQGTLYIYDEIPINITETDPTVPCVNDSVLVSATATGLFPPFTYSWQGGQTGTTAYFPTVQGTLTGSVSYLVTATNSCGYSSTDTVTITLNQTLIVDTLLSFPADCNPIGAVSAVIVGATGVPLYNWTGPGPNNPNFINASVWENLSSGWYYFTVTDDVCQANDSVFVDILPPPIANFMANPDSGCSPLEVLFNNNSQNASVYSWDFGNGNTATVGDLGPQVQVYTENAVIRLIASQGNCSDTAYATVLIAICGCMDPLATNYNPLANFDDGSCIYPAPTVEAPNVFTPNGDGTNDFWFLNTTNATNVSITILNRWGNVMHESEGLNPSWDGKTPNGSLAPDAVYFYKYRVEGYPDANGETQMLEGHGFLHLVRSM